MPIVQQSLLSFSKIGANMTRVQAVRKVVVSSSKVYLSPIVKVLTTLKDKKDEKKVSINKNTISSKRVLK